ncbi:efflux RND transporter permease subunit [Alloalcanivorax xenomutans]|uniref:efflux RND transporter permease subunit n=1 Tax=Alloalcanivorax xenomutans TaxID=1094342 RepID=UPI0013D1D4A9|nr:efflux RND transporter permease subunit [Alloalcanivorax xenomutans]WOA30398.1 efflux RND transporter permease subunit [Alloalcanivorax xenomutans]
MGIAEYAVRHRVVSWLFSIILLVGGILGFMRLGQLEDPEFTLKTAMVITPYPGASPREVEEEITLPLEKAIQSLSYVDYITSISNPGLSQITVEMKPIYREKDLKQIWDELRRKVNDLQPGLPPGAGNVRVMDDFGDVYGMLLALTGDDYSYQDLEDFANVLVRELVLVPGVGKVEIAGQREEQVFVELSRERLANLGISPQRIFSLLGTHNTVKPAGHVRVGDEHLRIAPGGELNSLATLRDLLISEPGADQLVYLGDVARIERGYREVPSHLYRHQGLAALTLGVSFAPRVNVVEVGARVRARLAELTHRQPAGMDIALVYDQPAEVKNSVNSFLWNLTQAVMIVIGVLLLFMGLRSGVLMGGVLLLTILGTFVVMAVMGIELQRISLGALIIALGMLVDNAIVITEGILVGIKRGLSKVAAAAAIVRQTAWPLLGATVIAITAFAPIGLSSDASGEFTNSLFWVLLISLLLSWVVAITLTPFFADLIFSRDKVSDDNDEREDPYAGRFFHLYRGLLERAIHHRVLTLVLMGVLLVASVAGFGLVKQSFFPPSNTPIFLIDYWLPEGSDIRATVDNTARLEASLQEMEQVTGVTSTIGQGAQRFMLPYFPEKAYPSFAQLIVRVDQRDNIEAVIRETRERLEQEHLSAFAKIKRLMIGPSASATIEARLAGPDPEVLRSLAVEVEAIMRSEPGLESIRHDWREKVKVVKPRLQQAQARRAGVTREDLQDALEMNFSGLRVGLFRDGADLLPIIARSPDEERLGADNLKRVRVWSPVFEDHIAIEQIVSRFDTELEDGLILRRDRKRTLTIQAEPKLLGEETGDQVLRRIRPEVEALPLPPGYELTWGGEYELTKDAQAAVFASVPLGYLFMFIITILLFDTLRQPLVIWATVPLAIIGVTIGLLTFNASFSFMALLGFLSLSGMQIKNGIVLVEQIKLELAEGAEPLTAVVHASVTRVRPVCMAAVTTILGMAPLLFDAFFRSMAAVIMFGLGFATVLTLIVVPVLYTLAYRMRPANSGTAWPSGLE